MPYLYGHRLWTSVYCLCASGLSFSAARICRFCFSVFFQSCMNLTALVRAVSVKYSKVEEYICLWADEVKQVDQGEFEDVEDGLKGRICQYGKGDGKHFQGSWEPNDVLHQSSSYGLSSKGQDQRGLKHLIPVLGGYILCTIHKQKAKQQRKEDTVIHQNHYQNACCEKIYPI